MYQELFRLQEEALKVIANQKRLEIIQLLSEGELTVTEMSVMLGIRQANVSQHLSLLRQSGILESRRDGSKIFYSLTDERIWEAVRLVRQFLQERYGGNLHMDALNDKASGLYPIVRDVVCGMRIGKSLAGASAHYEGVTYYFCASGCKERFERNPVDYLNNQGGKNG